MSKILVTGGPVHAKLDAVKIVTNRFRGGRMASIARFLAKRHAVTYLTACGMPTPNSFDDERERVKAEVVIHDGFIDYMNKVTRMANEFDMVVLGAAVANLIPEPPWSLDQKFPSHDYAEGELINVPFRVAPRVINDVKEANPHCTLVGFKLLSDVSDEELVRAAYTIVQDAKADVVVANDTANLDRKLIVTKERSVIEIHRTDGYTGLDSQVQAFLDLVDFLDELVKDKHYKTVIHPDYEIPEGQPVTAVRRIMRMAIQRFNSLQEHYKEELEEFGLHGTGPLFGGIAVRSVNNGFVCSTRGKRSSRDFTHVAKVYHEFREVHTIQGKASLNAPLLDSLFKHFPMAKAIVHTHRKGTELPKLPWAPPGTVRDSCRDDIPGADFEIENHGVFHIITELP